MGYVPNAAPNAVALCQSSLCLPPRPSALAPCQCVRHNQESASHNPRQGAKHASKLLPAQGKPPPCCALLQVRLQEPDSPPLIDMRVALATMDKLRLGLADRRLDASEAKTRLATLLAGRAVALALTPGIPPIEHISMQPRGGVMGRLLFENLVRHEHASLAIPWQALTLWQGSPCESAAGVECRRGAHASAWGCVQLEMSAQLQQASCWLQSSIPMCV